MLRVANVIRLMRGLNPRTRACSGKYTNGTQAVINEKRYNEVCDINILLPATTLVIILFCSDFQTSDTWSGINMKYTAIPLD